MSRVAPTIAAVAVPGGRYVVGAERIDEAEAPNPVHEVELSAFRMGLTPVTNEEYAAFVEATGAPLPAPCRDARFSGGRHPVVGVSWDGARAFAAWVGGSLPSEAQWEAACGTSRFPWGDDEPTERHAHFARDWNRGGTAAVGALPAGASRFGCLDMAGNVWEWCADAWSLDAHLRRHGSDPVVDAPGDVRPLRGGCWRSIDPKLQRAYRNWFHRVAAHVTIGFRVCFPV